MTLFADLRQVVCGSRCARSGGWDDVAHGKRVGIMACRVRPGGQPAGSPKPPSCSIWACSTTSACRPPGPLPSGRKFDWGRLRCTVVGHALLKGFAPLEAIARAGALPPPAGTAAPPTAWPRDTLRVANLIYLLDQWTPWRPATTPTTPRCCSTDEIRARIAEHAGTYFARAGGAVPRCLHAEAFWLQLEPRSIQARWSESLAGTRDYPAGTDERSSTSPPSSPASWTPRAPHPPSIRWAWACLVPPSGRAAGRAAGHLR